MMANMTKTCHYPRHLKWWLDHWGASKILTLTRFKIEFCQCQDFSMRLSRPMVHLSLIWVEVTQIMIIWQIAVHWEKWDSKEMGERGSAVNCVERKWKEYGWRITLRRSTIRYRTREKWGERFLPSRRERLGQEEHELCISLQVAQVSLQVAHLCHFALNVTCVEWNCKLRNLLKMFLKSCVEMI